MLINYFATLKYYFLLSFKININPTPWFLILHLIIMTLYNLIGCKYLFSYPKYASFLLTIQIENIPEAWPVAGTYSPTQNIRLFIYLRLVPVFPPKIQSPECTWDLAGCRYLFSHPKYEAGCVPVTAICFPTKNISCNMYLRPSRSELPVFSPKILARIYTWDLVVWKYIYLKPGRLEIPVFPSKILAVTCT